MRRALFALGAVFVSVAAAAAVGEATVRALHPTPRVQVVRGGHVPAPDVVALGDLAGEPVWALPGSEARRAPDCAPDARTVLLIGSSILWGTGYEADEVVSARLQERLDPTRSAWCVRNWAQPGYVGRQKVVTALDRITRDRPAVVVFEVWANDVGDYDRLGADAIEVGKLRRDADGYPVLVPGVPAAVHHALFLHSALWRYATLALAPADPGAYERHWRWLADEGLPAVLDATRAGGGRLLVVLAPFLDRPFAQSAAEHRDKLRGYVWVRAWAEGAGVEVVDLAERWTARDPSDLRHDPCCHYAPAGHDALAETLAPDVRALAGETP